MERLQLDKPELLSHGQQPTLLQEFVRSAVYGALQAPALGVAQIIDKSCGTETTKAVQFMASPEETEAMGLRWHAQQMGTMVGMIVPFLLLHKGVGKCGNLAFGKLEQNAARELLTRRVVGESIATGALFDGVFRPVAPNQQENFLQTRINNAVIGGATFGVLTRSSFGIQSLMKAEKGLGAAIIRSEIGSTILSGVPAGILNAEMTSKVTTGTHATTAQLVEAVYSFSVIGGVMAAGKHVVGGTQAEGQLSQELKEQSNRAIGEGQPTLLESAAYGFGSLTNGVTDLTCRLAGIPAQQMLVEGSPFALQSRVNEHANTLSATERQSGEVKPTNSPSGKTLLELSSHLEGTGPTKTAKAALETGKDKAAAQNSSGTKPGLEHEQAPPPEEIRLEITEIPPNSNWIESEKGNYHFGKNGQVDALLSADGFLLQKHESSWYLQTEDGWLMQPVSVTVSAEHVVIENSHDGIRAVYNKFGKWTESTRSGVSVPQPPEGSFVTLDGSYFQPLNPAAIIRENGCFAYNTSRRPLHSKPSAAIAPDLHWLVTRDGRCFEKIDGSWTEHTPGGSITHNGSIRADFGMIVIQDKTAGLKHTYNTTAGYTVVTDGPLTAPGAWSRHHEPGKTRYTLNCSDGQVELHAGPQPYSGVPSFTPEKIIVHGVQEFSLKRLSDSHSGVDKFQLKGPNGHQTIVEGSITVEANGTRLRLGEDVFEFKSTTKDELSSALLFRKPSVESPIAGQLAEFQKLTSQLAKAEIGAIEGNEVRSAVHDFVRSHRSVLLEQAIQDWAATQPRVIVDLVDHYYGPGKTWGRRAGYFNDLAAEEMRASKTADGPHLIGALGNIAENGRRRGVSDTQIDQTTRNVLGLLEDGRDPRLDTARLRTVSDLFRKAGFQMALQAADPTSINQAHHPTCALASLEVISYYRYPELATSLVQQVLRTGKFIAADGTVIRIDPFSLAAEFGAIDYSHANHYSNQRSYASQVFQTTAANLYWQTTTIAPSGRIVKPGSLRYELRMQPSEAGQPAVASGFVVDSFNRAWPAEGYTPMQIKRIAELIDPKLVVPRVPETSLTTVEQFKQWLGVQAPDQFPMIIGVDARYLRENLRNSPSAQHHAITIFGVFDQLVPGGPNKDAVVLKNSWRSGNTFTNVPTLWKMTYERPGASAPPALPTPVKK